MYPWKDLTAAGMVPKPATSTTNLVYLSTTDDVALKWAGVLSQVSGLPSAAKAGCVVVQLQGSCGCFPRSTTCISATAAYYNSGKECPD